jgi:tRNA G26 N,N-dimethylase Trm1
LATNVQVRDVRHNSCGAATPIHASKHIVTERGSEYDTGEAFYRAESAQARDLAVLAAIVLKKNVGHLKVIDGMCGCGGRTLRYFVQVCLSRCELMLVFTANSSSCMINAMLQE